MKRNVLKKVTTTPTKTALVAGASGLVGGELLKQLLAAPEYTKITVLTRRPLSLPADPRLNQLVTDFAALGEHPEPFAADAVFCCLGTTIKKAGSQAAFRKVDYEYPLEMGRLAKAVGAKRFLIVTSMGADPRSAFFYSRVKGEVEAALQALELPGLTIFRPSLLLGQRQEKRMGEGVAQMLARPLGWLMVGPLRRYRPIAGATVARAMYRAAGGDPKPAVYASDQIEALGKA